MRAGCTPRSISPARRETAPGAPDRQKRVRSQRRRGSVAAADASVELQQLDLQVAALDAAVATAMLTTLEERGVVRALGDGAYTLRHPVYLSLDLDVLDPAHVARRDARER